MLHTLPLLLSLSYLPAQEGKLEIVNPRSTYGHLGAPRPRAGVQGGDVFHFAFDVKGMSQDENGRVRYSLHMQVRDEKKQVVFNLGPRNATAINFLGGDTVPCAAHLEVPLDAAAGVHHLHVEIVDLASGRKAVFESQGNILPDDFGLVRVGTFADAEGRIPMSPIGVVGETLNVNFSAVNFVRDKKSKQPDVSVSMRVLDDQGKQVSPPLTGRANQDIPDDFQIIPMQFGVTLNRVGRFTIEVNAKDEHSGKTTQVTLPIQVFELK